MLTKPMPFYRFFSSFSLKNHFFRKIWKFPKISTILVKFQEFHQIWWNSLNSTNFGVLEFPITSIFTPSMHLKQKKVTLREVSRTAAKESLFHTKTAFSANFLFLGGISSFFVKSALFRPWASKKPPRTLCL